MRHTASLVALTLVAACGGSSGSKTFTYDASQPATQAELQSVGAGQTAVADGTAFHLSPSPSTGPSLPALADAMAAPLFDQSALPAPTPFARAMSEVASTAVFAALPSSASPAVATATWPAECITTTASSVTYAGCSQTASGLTLTLDGRVSRGTGSVDWSLRLTMKGNVSSGAGTLALDAGSDLEGTMAFGPGTAKGHSSSAVRATVSGAGIPSVTAAAKTAATVDLAYQASPFCVTGGTVELTRDWTARPIGMPSTPPYDDRGYLFTWSGCGQVTVAHSR